MNTPNILCHIENHIATLTFNRPENLNALDESMGLAFNKLVKDLDKNRDVRVIVITGAGRAFSSGGNLEMLEKKLVKTKSTNAKDLKNFYKIFLKIRDLKVPVIAAINGPAIGAGFCLSLACDLRYASSTAKLGANFAKLGLAPGMGGTYLITRLVGPTRAAEIMLLAETLTAEKAQKFGLLNDVVEPDNLLPHVMEVAKTIAANAPLPVRMIKKGIQKAIHASLVQMFDYDAKSQAECFESEDIKEGIQAVREKRAAQFLGK